MISWEKSHFVQVFDVPRQEAEGPEIFTEHGITLVNFKYETSFLKYEIIIDEENEQVSISADTDLPFGSESLYEIHVPCQLIVMKPDGYGRKFHFSFYRTKKENHEDLSLTVAIREDGNLVVWPYFAWNEFSKNNIQPPGGDGL